MNYYDSREDQYSEIPDWTFDFSNPSKNFFEECPFCLKKHRHGMRNGRNNSALCESCWVFLQGIYWFCPMHPMHRPDPTQPPFWKRHYEDLEKEMDEEDAKICKKCRKIVDNLYVRKEI